MTAEILRHVAVEDAERLLRESGISPFYCNIPVSPIQGLGYNYLHGLDYARLPPHLIDPVTVELQRLFQSIGAYPKTHITISPFYFGREKREYLVRGGCCPTTQDMERFLTPFSDPKHASLTVFVGTRNQVNTDRRGSQELVDWRYPYTEYRNQRVLGYSRMTLEAGVVNISMQFAPTVYTEDGNIRGGPLGNGYGKAVWPHRLAHIYYFAATRGARAIEAIVHHANIASQENLRNNGFRCIETEVPLHDLNMEHRYQVYAKAGITLDAPPSHVTGDHQRRDRYVATKVSLQASLRGEIGDRLAQVLGLEDFAPITDDAMDLIAAMHPVEFAVAVNNILNSRHIS
jgi:hypothetical protein